MKRPTTRRERAVRRLENNMARIDALIPEVPADDLHAFEMAMARHVSMFIGNRKQLWRGCPLRTCERARACIAPGGYCSNAPAPRHDPNASEEALARAAMQHALKAEGLQRILKEHASAPAPRVASSRRGRK